ncbi:MAG: AraC family transcriptional regulator [Flavobacteriales bacterium]|nr:AraC family transcriptional regulator [Flavobacteriales bacterium]
MPNIYNIKSITEAHKLLGLEKPMHPLISVFRHSPDMNLDFKDVSASFEMYLISLKRDIKGAINYGRSSYDFEEGTLLFLAPNQVVSVTNTPIIDPGGWSIFIHPDLIRKSELGANIHQYSFFDYDVNEALHVSEKEKNSLTEIVSKIEREINQNLDRHSQELIIHNLEAILKYCNRCYDRQFLTRTNYNKDFISRFEKHLNHCFSSNQLIEKGIPTVSECGKSLNMSGHYLSDLLKIETGKTAKEHIHLKLIERAKYKLLNSNLSVKSLAYDLGFEYPQNFSKLFKSKVGLSPSEYRNLN